MKGWKDEEFADRRLMAPCGLYCGTCGVYISTRDDNEKFREKLAVLYGSPSEETRCLGCMQDDPPECLFGFCQSCPMRECVIEKGLTSCHQCDDWPCDFVENFPLPVGRRVMKKAITKWRGLAEKHGLEAGAIEWAKSECERYHCPDCGEPLFRGAITCRACKADVADRLDGRN
jgi:Protein of unknown function (DUF3795)